MELCGLITVISQGQFKIRQYFIIKSKKMTFIHVYGHKKPQNIATLQQCDSVTWQKYKCRFLWQPKLVSNTEYWPTILAIPILQAPKFYTYNIIYVKWIIGYDTYPTNENKLTTKRVLFPGVFLCTIYFHPDHIPCYLHIIDLPT